MGPRFKGMRLIYETTPMAVKGGIQGLGIILEPHLAAFLRGSGSGLMISSLLFPGGPGEALKTTQAKFRLKEED